MNAKRLAIATMAVLVAAVGLVAAPVSQAVPPGSPQCNATGGTITASGSYFKHTFTATATFTPKQAMNVEYLVVGGGAGGGPVSARRSAAGGGGGGEVATSSAQAVTAGTAYAITIGAGGTAGTGTTVGGTGGSSSFGAIKTSVGGGGGGAGATNLNGVNGSSGGGGGDSGTAGTAGTGSPGKNGAAGFAGTNATRAGGGGGGMSVVGTAGASAAGGAGGAGTASSISGGSVTYGGGGGGGSFTTGGTGGSGGGGAGGTQVAVTLVPAAGSSGTANTGGGGGGAGNGTNVGTANGGAGGSGIVIIRYLKNAGCPTAPTSASFTTPTFSWVAPTPLPSGQTISSYTVVYRVQGSSSGWGIYARNGTATSLNIIAKTVATCGSANAVPWTCVLGKNDLVIGTTYEFKVFAKTSTTGFSAMSATVSHTAA